MAMASRALHQIVLRPCAMAIVHMELHGGVEEGAVEEAGGLEILDATTWHRGAPQAAHEMFLPVLGASPSAFTYLEAAPQQVLAHEHVGRSPDP